MRAFIISLWLGLGISLLGGPAAFAAEAYKCKGPHGETVFSDQPCKGEVIELHETQTYSADTPVNNNNSPAPATGKQKPAKLSVRINSPADGDTLRDVDGNVSVSASATPALPPGYRAFLTLDGAPVAEPGAGLFWSLQNVDRGEHALSVSVMDSSGKIVMTSPAVKFALFRPTVKQN